MKRSIRYVARCRHTVALAILLLGPVEIITAHGSDGPPVGRAPAAFLGPAFASTARSMTVGGQLTLSGVRLETETAPLTLTLERFEVFAPDARIVLNGGPQPELLPVPRTAYFRGTVDADPGSLALLIVRETGERSGFLSRGGRLYGFANPDRDPRRPYMAVLRELPENPLAAQLAERFRCETDELLPPPRVRRARPAPAAIESSIRYKVELAIETDFEYYRMFPSATAATNYIGDLVAGASAVYARDVNVVFLLSYTSLWSNSSDPWVATTPSCGLYEFGGYWSLNRQGVKRDVAHFLSGKDLGGGVAWVGVLCRPDFNTTGSCPGVTVPLKGGSYGFSSGVTGSFNVNNPENPLVWDIVVFTHEIGHNFNSPHTHCYGDIPSPGDPPVDKCYNAQTGTGCWGGATSLPSGGGSIMSYCHQLPGGLRNLNLWFGRENYYGTRSERVPQRMRAEVESVAASCLDPDGDSPEVWHNWFAVDTRETPYVGDFNGDGRTDIITFTRDNPLSFGDVYVALSTGSSFGENKKWNDWFAISPDEEVVIGDYNGDGKADIATWLKKSTKQVYVAPSRGSGMDPADVWLGSIGTGDGDVLKAGDANGDGKADLVLFARTQGKVYVALSTGQGFQAPLKWHDFFAVSTYERPEVGDVNGDGKVDILTFATDSPTAYGDVYVATSTGSAFGPNAKWHDWFAIQPTEVVRIGDKNGDRKSDFFTFLPAPQNQVYAVESQGGSMGPNILLVSWSPAPNPSDRFYVGDATGDGKADIIQFAQTEGKVKVMRTR